MRSKKLASSTSRATKQICSVLIAALCLTSPVLLSAQPVGLPSMGAASALELSPALEATLGDAIMEEGRRDPSYISDPDVSQYLTNMGRRLAAQSVGANSQRITVFALRDASINAFALPGGYIGVNSGLIVSSQTESELASVISHEIAHVTLRHIARGMTQSSQTNTLMIAALAGALLAALAGSGDLAMGVAAFGQAAAIDRQLGFSRQAEQEADRTGFEMMRKAGFDTRGMMRMFNQLMNASRLNEGAGGNVYTSTHPLSVQRMSDIENRINDDNANVKPDSDTFWYIRAKLRLVQARDAQSIRNALSVLDGETQKATGVIQSAAWYGLAYEAWRKKEYAAAASALAKASAQGRSSPEITELAIHLALDQGKYESASSLASDAVQRWPDNLAVALAQAQALQKAGDDSTAVKLLKRRTLQWPDVPRLHQLQAQGYERLGQKIEARQSMAAYYELIGALPAAVAQLQQARNLSNDFYLQSQLDVQIRTMQEKLKADRALLERFRTS